MTDMPSILVKAAPDRDLYCIWSTVVDNVTWIGTRADMLTDPRGGMFTSDRIERVDKYGTSVVTREDNPESSYSTRAYGWDDYGFVVTNIANSPMPFYWLLRANLAAYLDAVMAGDDDAMYDVLDILPTEEG